MKREKLKHAGSLLQEISQDMQSFIRSLPQAVINQAIIKKREKQVLNEARATEHKKPSQSPARKKKSSELKRLESELYEIRSKLSSLNI